MTPAPTEMDACFAILGTLHALRNQLTDAQESLAAASQRFSALMDEIRSLKAERDALADELRQARERAA